MLIRFLRTFTEILFPPSPEERRVEQLNKEGVLLYLQPHQANNATTLCSYSDPDVRALILRTKYHRDERATGLLGYMLAQYLKQNDMCDHILIPVPLSETRFRERGYNQVTAVLKSARKHVPLTIREDVLQRTRHTEKQTDITRSERLKNVERAFEATDTIVETHTPILLIDDVLTTGATLNAAREALERRGHKDISCLALAH